MGSSHSTNSRPATGSGAVVGRQLCASHPDDLTFTTKAPGVKPGRLAVLDADGKVIYKVKSASSWNSKKLLVDAATDRPVLTMRPKDWTAHERWQVFKGDSSNNKNLMFSVKRSSAFQINTKLNVFLASNKKENACDFTIKGSFRKRKCTVYKGDTSVVVAQMSKKNKAKVNKNAFGVRISQNTDTAFIISLFAIIRMLHKQAVEEMQGHAVTIAVDVITNAM